MAAATSVTSYVTVHGPIKIEWVQCTMAASADFYISKLVGPKFAIANTNTATNTVQATTGIGTGTNAKKVTVTSTDISATVVHLIIVGH